MEQPSTPVKQKDAVSIVRSGKNVSTNPFGFPPKGQQSMYRPQNPGHSQQFRQGPPPIPSPIRPSAPVAHTQDTSWMITSSFGPQRPPLKEITGTNQPRTMQQTKVREEDYRENMSKSISQIFSNFQCIQCVPCRKEDPLLRTRWGSWLQLLMAWDTGASSKTKFLSSLRYLVSLLAVDVIFYIRTSGRRKMSWLSPQLLWTLQSRRAATGPRTSSWETGRRLYSASSMKMWVREGKLSQRK